MNVKELIRRVEEIYSFKFEQKQTNMAPSQQSSLQEASARFLAHKFQTKSKIDQSAMDLITSIEYHRQSCIEADLFYRFFTQQYSEQDLMFFLFERSLAERELNIKLALTKNSFDIRTQMIPQAKAHKIAKIYFQNVSMNDTGFSNSDNLASQFMSQMLNAAREAEEFENELYSVIKGTVHIQLMFFLIKMLREFQTQKLKNSQTSMQQFQQEQQIPLEPHQNFVSGSGQNVNTGPGFQPIEEHISQENYKSNQYQEQNNEHTIMENGGPEDFINRLQPASQFQNSMQFSQREEGHFEGSNRFNLANIQPAKSPVQSNMLDNIHYKIIDQVCDQVINGKINSALTHMLSQMNLQKTVLDTIREESKQTLQSLIY